MTEQPPPGPPAPPPPQPAYQPYPTPYPAYPTQPGWQGPQPKKTLAGWALGLAIFPSLITWIIAVVFAISVLRDTARTGVDHGRRMAIGALVVVGGWLVVAALIVVAVAVSGVERDDDGQVTDGGRILIVNTEPGDCLPAPSLSEDGQRLVELVPCDQPHDAEVYASWELGGSWTSLDDVDQTSQAGCIDRFEPYVGKSYTGRPARRSELDVIYFLPMDEAAFRADPTVICILVAPGQVTGTLKGSQR